MRYGAAKVFAPMRPARELFSPPQVGAYGIYFANPQPATSTDALDRIAYVLNGIISQSIPTATGTFQDPQPSGDAQAINRLAAVVVSYISALIPNVPAGTYVNPQPATVQDRIDRLAGVISSLLGGSVP